MSVEMEHPLVPVIGVLTTKAQQPPAGSESVQLAWRVGYQNAMADLIAEVFPGRGGGRRLSMEELAANDEQRRVAVEGTP